MIRIKILKESKSLLQELDYEQVKQRFDSKKFKRAAANPGPRAPIPTYVSPPWSPEKIQSHLATIVQRAVPADITEKDKATALNWLISTAIKTRFTGLSPDVRSQLEIFFQIKQQKLDRFLSKKDINQIKDFSELYDVVNKSRGPYKDHLASKVNPTQAKAGEKLIHSDNEYDVYIPETKAAACSLGKGTNWCTAAPGLDYYNEYHTPDDPLIIFKDKDDPSKDVQMHFGTDQFMDADDEPIDGDLRIPLVFRLKGNRFLPEKILQAVSKYDFEDFGDGRYMLKDDKGEFWYLNGLSHREDGPARAYANGKKEWYLNGRPHRVDGPAFESPFGSKEWYLNGKYHRVDGPAVEYPSGTKEWYLNGEYHREDGPAIETLSGTKHWYLNGKRHRVDGPAIETSTGSKSWWLNGKHYIDGPGPADEYEATQWTDAGGQLSLREIFKKYLK